MYSRQQVVEGLYSLCEKQLIHLYNHQSGVKSVITTGPESITNQTIICIRAPLEEVRQAYLNKHEHVVQEVGREQPVVQLFGKLRDYIANPTKTAQHSADLDSVLAATHSLI